MSKTKQVVLGKKPRLIDLNGNSTNFEATCVIQSQDKTPFELAVVDQDTLDSTGYPPMRQVKNGYVSTTVTYADDVYKMYYLVLQSETPCEVAVDITKRDIQPNPQKSQNSQSSQNSQQQTSDITSTMQGCQSQEQSGDQGVSWITLSIIGVAVVACAVGFYLYQSSDGNDNEVMPASPKSPILPPPSPVPVSIPKVDNLLDKLDSLEIN
jgi:hypothetical protein